MKPCMLCVNHARDIFSSLIQLDHESVSHKDMVVVVVKYSCFNYIMALTHGP